MSPALHAAGNHLSTALEHVPAAPHAGLPLTLSVASLVAQVAYTMGGYSFATPLITSLMKVMPATMLTWDTLSRAQSKRSR